MIDFKLIELSQKEKWNEMIARLPIEQQDIYYTPEYYSIYEKKGDGKAQCFVYERDGEIALYPFLINSVNDLGFKLNKQYFDIQGAYGYNGVATSSCEESFKKSFYTAFQNFIEEHSIIAEFTRFNPFLKNELFSDYLESKYNQDNVMLI